jgi:hypothetical protein
MNAILNELADLAADTVGANKDLTKMVFQINFDYTGADVMEAANYANKMDDPQNDEAHDSNIAIEVLKKVEEETFSQFGDDLFDILSHFYGYGDYSLSYRIIDSFTNGTEYFDGKDIKAIVERLNDDSFGKFESNAAAAEYYFGSFMAEEIPEALVRYINWEEYFESDLQHSLNWVAGWYFFC